MCVVSMIMDHYSDKWGRHQPPATITIPAVSIPPIMVPAPVPAITPAEVEEFRKLLERAREYDRKNNEPNCELEEKRQKLKKIAAELGVDIAFV